MRCGTSSATIRCERCWPPWGRRIGPIRERLEAAKARIRDENARDLLRDRNEVVDAYDELVDRGGAWTPPVWVREAMAKWLIDSAVERIAEAEAVLALRHTLEGTIARLDLTTIPGIEERYESAVIGLDDLRSEIEELSEAPAGVSDEDRSLLDRLGSAIDESIQSMNASRRLNELRETASNAAEHIVNLIVLFVLQTILLPLGIFWLLLEIVKGFVARMAQRPA